MQHFKVSPEMMKELSDTFKLLDTDGSGALEAQEVYDGFAALGIYRRAVSIGARYL